MKAVSILLSFAFTVATIEALGLLLLQWLRPRFTKQEQYVFGFVSGSALLSLVVFLLAAVQVVWTASFVAVGVIAIVVCWRKRAWVPLKESFPRLPVLDRLMLTSTMLAFGAWYFMNALAPEASSDGTMYHLGLVQRYMDQHGFGRVTTSMYGNMPLAIEMLFLFAFSLGRHSAAALVHFSFLIALPFAIVVFGRRFGHPRAGVVAAILVYASPIFGFDGSSAYVDVAAACVAFTLFALMQRWDETREPCLVPLIGLLAGYAYSVKLTLFVAIPYAVIFVLWKLWRRRAEIAKPMMILCACVLLMVGPWLLKNVITVGNPFSPFMNRWFPNPNIRISFETSYREFQRNYSGLKSYLDIPLELTIRGGVLNGFLGPVFLLAPLGLLGLRWQVGRQALLAALVFALPYPNNIGTRFLMPATPFLALSLALVLERWRAMGPLVVLFHFLVSWPDSIGLYADQYAWRLEKFYWRGALRLQPESEYLNDRVPEYAPAKLIENLVPKNGRVFTTGGIAVAYCRRNVVVGYESAFGNTLFDFVAAATVPAFQPTHWWTYKFPKQSTRRVRLVQVQTGKEDWSVSELRLIGPEGEIPRGVNWRLRAAPNPWDVQLAFDNCPITKWTAAEPTRPGMFVEIELDKPVELTEVRAEVTPSWPGRARLEIEVDGQWNVIEAQPELTEGSPLKRSRRLAIEDLKRNGMTHIAVHSDDFFVADITKSPQLWGVTLLGEANAIRLYRLD